MRILSTKAHGIMDYLVSVLLIASPWLFNFAHGGAETAVPVALGITTIVYSLITNYEYSVVAAIPFRAHLVLDAISGIFLILSPWLLGFADTIFGPHVIFGLLELGVVLISQRTVGVQSRMHQHV